MGLGSLEISWLGFATAIYSPAPDRRAPIEQHLVRQRTGVRF